jgi:hypothetical protein
MMDKSDCINKEVAQIVNTLLKAYIDISRRQMGLLQDITDLTFDLDLFTCTVLLTIDEENEFRQGTPKERIAVGDYADMQEILRQVFLKESDDHNTVVVKGYFPSFEDAEISLFYITSFWLYCNMVQAEEKSRFALLTLELPSGRFCKEKNREYIDKFNTIIHPLVSDGTVGLLNENGYSVSDTRTVGKQMADMAMEFLKKYGQVYVPRNVGYKQYDRFVSTYERIDYFYEMIDYYMELYCRFLNN